MNTHERRISKIEAAAGVDHTGKIEVFDMYAMHVIYDNFQNGTKDPVPSRWVDEESIEGKQYISKMEKYLERVKK